MVAISITQRTRTLLFAFLMSANTALMTTGFVVYTHAKPNVSFVHAWFKAFINVWPVVFLMILIIAPLLNRCLDKLFTVRKK